MRDSSSICSLCSYRARILTRGLPRLHSRGGKPYSSSCSDMMRQALSAREIDVLDCVHLQLQKLLGHIPSMLVVDVSQSLERVKFRTDGLMPTVTTGSKIWFEDRVMPPSILFTCNGWPANRAILPASIPPSAYSRLLGNIVCVPVIGSVMLAVDAV